ncbi:MAG: GntR family transcriptional regulator [Victivallaceae bacterium]|nr:GntR family transcriptional regulator [Victivallaceae bacterium]
MQINKESSEPIYLQLAENIKQKICGAGIQASEPIPSERKLADIFNLNRGTVRKAFEILLQENIVERAGNRLVVCEKFIESQQSAITRAGIILFNKFSFFFNKNHGVLDFVQGITDACSDLNAVPQILQAPDTLQMNESARKWFDFVQDNTDVIIHLGTRLVECEEHDEILARLLMIEKPQACVIGHFSKGNVMPILPNEDSGTPEAAKLLVSLGHKNICVMGWQEKHGSLFIAKSFSRADGMKECCEREGMNVTLVKLDPSNHFQHDLRKCLEEMIHSPKRITAVMCGNDHIAEQVINQLKNLSVSVPDDISVIGYDDITKAKLLNPPLTTIRYPRYEIGYETVRRLLEVFRKTDIKSPNHYNLDLSLVVRDSVQTASTALALNSLNNI